jgi:hypothetical protein
MLEILMLIYLCKRTGVAVRRKGRTEWPYQLLMAGGWFGGELAGLCLGIVLSEEIGIAYALALAGAAVGTVVVFIIVVNLAPAWQRDRRGFDVVVSGQTPVPPMRLPPRPRL